MALQFFSTKDIAKKCNCKVQTVSRWAKENNGFTRTRGGDPTLGFREKGDGVVILK